MLHHLGDRFAIHWTLRAKSGVTTAWAHAQLNEMAGQQFDAVVLALGVNDVKNGVPLERWREIYSGLLSDLAGSFGARVICVSAVPPMGQFPALPAMLARTLGARAARFDMHLQEMAKALPQAQHMPFDFDLTPDHMARDGFHPGPAIYDAWGKAVADIIRAALAEPPRST